MIAVAALLAVAAPPTLGVAALAERHVSLAGRTVRVRGRLAECSPAACGLLDDMQVAAPVTQVGFAPDPAFDRAARRLLGRRIVVEGVVSPTCWPPADHPLKVMCLGRPAQFRPLRIVAVLPDGGAR